MSVVPGIIATVSLVGILGLGALGGLAMVYLDRYQARSRSSHH